ncbi:hypothetical protein [Pontibacter sp. G13]|uniref:hypothetical protein n=1 Tax=Pontibacter sp. G13 TaxID=3074898 RepID=UPI00288C0A0A|nr:hypothetical protein [Pontibacter sp. G13]WNJ21372.1 hypothetical protein RJD25_12965 [Pontibacter sp. G13]
MNRLVWICCWAICMFTGIAFGQNQSDEAFQGFERRQFDREELERIIEEEDLHYQTYHTPQKQADTGWVGTLLDAMKESATILWIVLIAVLAIGLLYLIAKNIVFQRGRSIPSPIQEESEIEDIEELDLHTLIRQAQKDKDYLKLIRWEFLLVLQGLSQANLINWQPNKTNNDYRIELAGTPYAKPFDRLTLLFDYTQYGQIEVNESIIQQFQPTLDEFSKLKQKVR